MVSSRFAVGLWLLTAVLLQLGVVNRLHIPQGDPNLALVTVLSLALIEGPAFGMSAGFAAGLLGDLLGTHTLGRLAVVWTVMGYGLGLLHVDNARSSRNPLAPMLFIGLGSLVATLGYAALAVVSGEAHAPVGQLARLSLVTAVYNVLLTPFIFPVLRALLTRLDPSKV
jgi:rod shape-determining protein MreD